MNANHLIKSTARAAVAAACLSSIALSAQTVSVPFASDPTWAVSNSSATLVGFAQNVCLNASYPSNCPGTATQYGYFGSGWGADLTPIPGATWIWAPGITGATAPAFPAQYGFSKSFSLPGTPLAGSISVAADDAAEILVNGSSVGTIGSVTNGSLAGAAQSSLTTFDITSSLVQGSNVVTVRGINGNFGCGSGAYSCNTAGVVFGGSLQYKVTDLEVAVDIKPESAVNSINPRSQGVIPVAVLSTADFDATTIAVISVRFGAAGTEASPANYVLQDVNGDGRLDLLLHFRTNQTRIACGATAAKLSGKTTNGLNVHGTDAVVTVGCQS